LKRPVWITDLFAAPAAAKAPLQIGRFAIGVCPGCRQLRGVRSLRCDYCNNTALVTEDS
jgi:LSD1 subclass zinc finger protein